MEPCRSFGRIIKPQSLGIAALFGCVLIPAIIFSFVKSSSSYPMPFLSLQVSIQTYIPLSKAESSSSKQGIAGIEMIEMPVETSEKRVEVSPENSTEKRPPLSSVENLEQVQQENKSSSVQANNSKVEASSVSSNTTQDSNNTFSGDQMINTTNDAEGSQVKSNSDLGTGMLALAPPASHTNEQKELTAINKEPNGHNSGKIVCNFAEQRSDTCSMYGDVRVLGSSSSILLASSDSHNPSDANSSWKIRPYPRKWEPELMANIKEMTLKLSSDTKEIPSCSVNYKVPAIVFSTGGFLGNFFHDVTDVLVPLFITSRQYGGEVQFLVTNFNYKWLRKYQPILSQLSRYEIINLDIDTRVHCFRQVHVGLISHKVMGIDSTKSPNGYSMADFKELLRTSLSLKRKTIRKHTKKPRLLILLRKGSRSFTNEREVIAMARRSGYKVIAARPDKMKNLAEFAGIVNSCDVMMGVHGAGLANMVFLPTNATIIQIIPWGAITYGCRYDFGKPAPDMGLNYLDYEIKEEESSLIEQYPRNHAVFKDPLSIHRQGFNTIWSIFLNQQKVKLDVTRFRNILKGVIQTLQQ